MSELNGQQPRPYGWRTLIVDWWQRADVGTDIQRIAALVLLALGVGLLFNVCRIWPQERRIAVIPQAQPEARSISMAEAYRLATSGEALVVCAEEPEWYEEQHIAGAVNLPDNEDGDFEQYWTDFTGKVPQDQILILYCEPGCMSKEGVAEQLLDLGYRDVRLMNEGPEQWEAAGHAIVHGPAAGSMVEE